MSLPPADSTESGMPRDLPLRMLIDEIGALTLHVQQLSRMAGEARELMERNQDQVAQDDAPHAPVDEIQAFHLGLEDAIARIFEDAFGPRTDTLERQMSMRLIAEIGPAAFVQKVLWGEEITDIALTIALERMLPALEKLVEQCPQAFLGPANALLDQFKNR